MKNFGTISQEQVISTGAEAVQAIQSASDESSAFVQQAAVHPDQIAENAKKMSVLGWVVTLYTLNWFRKMIF